MEKQKSVLITGCSEGGIGDAVAQECLRRGCQVFATARNLKTVQHLKELGCEICRLDVTDLESVKGAVEFVSQKTGGELGVLVNNAGTAYNASILDTDLALSKAQFDINYWGVLSTTQQFFPLLRKGKGTIVNIGSVISLLPMGFFSPYRSTKVAVEALSHAMRMEMEPFGLHVVHVTLAMVKSNIETKAPNGGKLPENSLYAPIREQFEASMHPNLPTITSEVFAKRFVSQFLKKNPPAVLYDGGGVVMVRILAALSSIFGPRFFDWFTGSGSGLTDLWKIVKADEEGKDKNI